jgi:hypothetical protein
VVTSFALRLEVRAGGAPAVPPHFAAARAASLGPMTGAGRRGLLGRRLFFPRLGSVVHEWTKATFTAAGGSLGFDRSRYFSPSLPLAGR